MQNNFLKFLEENGPEEFDKMAADIVKQLNEAKTTYEANQKKKEEDEKNRKTVLEQMGRLLKFYYGDRLGMDPGKAAKIALDAVDKAIPVTKDVKSKLEVIKDEDTPIGHVKVMRGDLSDLTDEELEDFWNGVHEAFFKVD